MVKYTRSTQRGPVNRGKRANRSTPASLGWRARCAPCRRSQVARSDGRFRGDGRGDHRGPAPSNLVAPDQVVAPHPRPDRREASSGVTGSGRSSRTRTPSPARHRPARGSSPDARARRPRASGPSGPGQLVISILAGATSRAPSGTRPPRGRAHHAEHAGAARAGRDRLVRNARTVSASSAAAETLLGALGAQSGRGPVAVAMATAVSGTGPTYVFLVMEALIEPPCTRVLAPRRARPRHRDLEGSTLFAQESGLHPAELRNMVTSPGGTSAALHELEQGGSGRSSRRRSRRRSGAPSSSASSSRRGSRRTQLLAGVATPGPRGGRCSAPVWAVGGAGRGRRHRPRHARTMCTSRPADTAKSPGAARASRSGPLRDAAAARSVGRDLDGLTAPTPHQRRQRTAKRPL